MIGRRAPRLVAKGDGCGLWTALGVQKVVVVKNKRHTVSLFRCACGTEKWKRDCDMIAGTSRSCRGCMIKKRRPVMHLTPEEKERKKYVDRLWPNR